MPDAFWQDLRHALRGLRSSPGFAAVAILSLALGIGANTAIFSLIDAVMLKYLPVRDPEQLLQVTMASPMYLSNLAWEQIRDREDVFSGVFAYGLWHFNLANGGEVRNVNGSYVSGHFFDTLGVRAILGRTLAPVDDRRGCPGAAVLTYGFWQREYGGRTGVLGSTISLDGHPIEIVGVTEPGYTGVDVGNSVDVMVPLCTERILHGETSLLDVRMLPGWLRIIGRPTQGISATRVTARLKMLAPEIFRATLPPNLAPDDRQDYLARTLDTQSAATGLSYLRRQYRLPLMILMAMVALVLLVACANVANLLLARGAARNREIAIRVALGCGRGRLIRQLLTESLLLAGAGAALGIVFAKWGTSLLVSFLDVSLDLRLDIRLLAFTIGVAVLTGLLFGIAPAWRAARVSPQAAMKANSRGVIEGAKFGLGKGLAVVQVALSMLLVVGAGLMLSTFWKLVSLDPGFERDRVLLTGVDAHHGQAAPEHRLAEFRQILQKLRTIPSVHSASASTVTPISQAHWLQDLVLEGDVAGPRQATVFFNQVSDGYFETLGIALLAGRDFTAHDTPGSPPVAIINQALARKYFGGRNPLGGHFRMRDGDRLGDSLEIVGIVKDAKYNTLREEAPPTIYAAWNQQPKPRPFTNFELRAAGGAPSALIGAAKSAVAEVDRNISLEFTTLAAQVDESLRREQLLATLSGFFGGLALLLATIGLYGVMSYNVARRRNEIGIRMALGAEQVRVLRMVMREVAVLVGAGLVAGLAAALATTRFLASFLYGLQPNDPLTLALAAATLATVAFAAGFLPARRASRLDPMAALREE